MAVFTHLPAQRGSALFHTYAARLHLHRIDSSHHVYFFNRVHFSHAMLYNRRAGIFIERFALGLLSFPDYYFVFVQCMGML